MGKKIVLIGAGSHVFTRNLVRDILSFPAFADATLALVDIDPKGLEFSRKVVERIIEAGGYPAKIITTTDRREVLPGADGVLSMIRSYPLEVYRSDFEICAKYGIKQNVGDTRNPAGFFLYLRTIPIMLEILRDIQELCPRAVFLNYTNPMAMLCRTMQEVAPDLRITGLCHSVQQTSEKLAAIAGVPYQELEYTCAGINHMSYFTKLEHNGVSIYPAIRKATLEDKDVYEADIVRNEMFLATGYYVTESSGHFSEYSPWFRKREDLLEEYCYRGTSWNPGFTRSISRIEQFMASREKDVEKFMTEPVQLERGHEYAAYIFNAIFGDETMFKFNGNVRNFGLIDNLPTGACVEVPILASRNGFEPIHVGSLPDAVLPLVSLSSQLEEMVVKASLTGDKDLVYQAMIYDPLTSAVLGLREIRALCDEMFAFNEPYLPQFKK